MLRPDTLALTALLALLTAVGPMSVDLYLPSLPQIGRVFDASVPQVQLTLSGYLFCFAIGQIVCCARIRDTITAADTQSRGRRCHRAIGGAYSSASDGMW